MRHQAYDLHMHSTASDGTLSPLDLLERAVQRSLQVIALTDHDTVEGVRQLIAEAPDKLTVIPGAEFTCVWRGRVVHIVGLGLSLESEVLQTYLKRLDLLREERAEKINQRLMKKNIPSLLGLVNERAENSVIGRPHFAQAMVELGIVNSEQQAFNQYLGSGKVGDVKVDWPELSDVLAVIRESGGLAVFAHPTKYKFTFTKIREFLADFAELGGEGIEVSYTGISPSHHHELIRMADMFDLKVSAGSDFHSPKHHWTDVGRFMPIKKDVPHVLDALM